MTFSSDIPIGSQIWKEDVGSWIGPLPTVGQEDDGDNIITLEITDGGTGDADGTINGQITDPGGIAQVVSTDGAIVYYSNVDER